MSKTVVVTVSGGCAKVGKTLLVEKLLPAFVNAVAIKAQVHDDHAFAVVEERDVSESPGKDTSRYLAAGAQRAFLVSGPRGCVREAVNEIIAGENGSVVIVESNAMANDLESDVSFFIRGDGDGKPGAEECEQNADVVVSSISLKGGGADAD